MYQQDELLNRINILQKQLDEEINDNDFSNYQKLLAISVELDELIINLLRGKPQSV